MLVFFLVSLIGLISASYHDLKTRTIPNCISFFFFAAGIILNLLFSKSFLMPIFACLIAFIVGLFFWKTNSWGGGDVKIFTALAFLNPYTIFWTYIGTTILTTTTLITLKIIKKKAVLPFAPFLLISQTATYFNQSGVI